MHLSIFGASGGIGRHLVREALARGHTVTAVVRPGSKVEAAGAGLTIVEVASFDADTLAPHVAGRDAVVSGLGARSRKDAGVAARLTAALVAAMEEAGPRRLVVVSAAPLAPRSAEDSWFTRAILFPILCRALRAIYDDLREMEALLASSSLEWTSVRPPRLLDGAGKGIYRKVVGGNVPRGPSIDRIDVARAMLDMIEDRSTVHQGVGVAW